VREITIGFGIFVVVVWLTWGTCYCLWKANGSP